MMPYQPEPDRPAHTPPPSPLPGPHTPPPQQQQPILIIRPNSGRATASMVLGIIGAGGGWCMLGIPCLIAILLGHQGLTETRSGQMSGHGQAVAGLILGYLFAVPWVLVGIMWLVGTVVGAFG